MQRFAVLVLLLPALASAQTPIPSPTVTGPIAGGVRTGQPYNASLFDLAGNGYLEEEFFVSGTARNHTGLQPPLPFTTRMVVRRPADAERFNGTVWIEWLNVTGGNDIETDYAYLVQEILRSGYAAVIMSCQAVGVSYLKAWDPVRYAPLVHPGDAYAADICSQAGEALRNPASLDPMGGLDVQRLILEGESQSASQLEAYVNDVAPLIEPVFDGFILAVGGGNSFRADLDVRVLQVLSELELTSAAGGPPDSAFFRRWEIAGGAHSDRYSLDYVGHSFDRDHGLPPGTSIFNGPEDRGCLHNRAPKMLVHRAALHHMDRWIAEGVLPPTAPRVQFAGSSIARDAHGNALGGLRLPHVDVPVATYTGAAADSCSPLSGKTVFFDQTKLAALYPSQEAYEDALRAATDQAASAGFILPADAHYWYCGDFVLGEQLKFSPFDDCDADGVADPIDDCPQRANPVGEDDGGIASSVADGIGNACQCGDVTGNGEVNGQDAHAIRHHGLGGEPNPLFVAPQHCDVSGNDLCNGQDANAVRREALGITPNPLFGRYACESARGDLWK